MTGTVSVAREMIAGMAPELHVGRYVFCEAVDADWARLRPLGMFREAEGVSLILEQSSAELEGLAVGSPMALITLNVYSALEGVGLTVAVATALAEAGIACNMVAALRHDHVFVPFYQAADAMSVLLDLQARTRLSAP